MVRQIEWWLENGPINEQSLVSNFFIFLKIMFQFNNFL